MSDASSPPTVWRIPATPSVFIALIALLLTIAWGHWYFVAGYTTLYLGLPGWLWVQLGIILLLLAIAWLAVTVWSTANAPETGE